MKSPTIRVLEKVIELNYKCNLDRHYKGNHRWFGIDAGR